MFLVACDKKALIEQNYIIPQIPRVICEKFMFDSDPVNYKEQDLNELILRWYEINDVCYKSKLEQDKYLNTLIEKNSSK